MSRSERVRVLDQVRARLSDLTDATLDTVRAAVPAYRDMRGDQLRDVEAITSWVLIRLLRAWAEGGGVLDDADRGRFRRIGAARAEDGRPLTAVLRAYRVAAVAATEHLREIGRGRLDVDDVADLTTVLLTALDDLSESLMSGYGAARDRLSTDLDRARRDLLDDLIVGRQSSAGALADRSRELGLELAAEPSLLLVEPADSATAIGESAAHDLFPDTGARPLLTLHGPRAVLLLNVRPGPELDRTCQDRGWRGCLIVGHPITAVAAIHRLARHALDTAPAHSFRDRALLDEGDARFLAVLAARPDADPAALDRAVLGPIAAPSQRHLLDGLTAFLAAGTVTDAATRLHLHPQTLRYRLRRVRDLTGRDPHDPWHHLVLAAAAQLHGVRDQAQ